MDFVVARGQKFQESFNFKAENGKPVAAPQAEVVLIMRRGDFAKRYEVGSGMNRARTSIAWTMTEEETKALPYNIMYYTLYIGDAEFLRGILKIQ